MSKNFKISIFLLVFKTAMSFMFLPAQAQEAPAKVCIELATAEGITERSERHTFIIECAAQLRAANIQNGVVAQQAVYRENGPSVANRHVRTRRGTPSAGLDQVILASHDFADLAQRAIGIKNQNRYGGFFGGGFGGNYGGSYGGGNVGNIRPGDPVYGRIVSQTGPCAIRTSYTDQNGVLRAGPEVPCY